MKTKVKLTMNLVEWNLIPAEWNLDSYDAACQKGGKWDIYIDSKLVSTGLRSLDWTGNQWKEFILKNVKK